MLIPITIVVPEMGVDNLGSATATLGAINVNTRILAFNSAAADLRVTGQISGNGQFKKTGAQAALLDGPTTGGYTLDIQQGLLRLSTDDANPFPGFAGVIDGILDLNGKSRTVTFFSGTGTIALGPATLSTIGIEFIETVFSGAIVGAGGVTVTAIGQVRFAGSRPNTYTGPTLVRNGLLTLGKDSGITAVAGPLVVGDGATPGALTFNATVDVRRPEQIARGVPVVVDSDGDIRLSAVNHAGSLTILGGEVTLGSASVQLVLDGDVTATSKGISITPGGSYLISDPTPARITSAGGSLSLGGATRVFTVNDGPLPIDLSVEAPISGVGAEGLSKAGAGTMALHATATYTGTTTVNAGTLLVDGALPATSMSLVGGTLGGVGTMGAITATGGRLAPGSAPEGKGIGTLRSGTVTLNGSAMFTPELNGTTAGSGYDQLKVTGVVNLIHATLLPSIGFAPPAGASFTILDNDLADLVAGTFAGLPEGARLTSGPYTFTISYVGGDGNDIVLTSLNVLTYFLAEGATGGFFDEDVLLANPNNVEAPVTLTFFKPDGTTVVVERTLASRSHLTLHVDQIPGLEQTTPSVQVTSNNALPLAVERSMFWDPRYYGGHTASAVDGTALRWLFAEGNQGFFDTYVLVTNANATPAELTVTFLREGDTPIVKVLPIGASSRLTIYAGDYPELIGGSFGISVEATLPVIAERAMYFGTTADRLWSGGHGSAGVAAPATDWFLAEGATGGFFDTFILVSNPNDAIAYVNVTYLLEGGATIVVPKSIAPRGRLTINIESEADVRLHNASVSTIVTSTIPIVAERSMYWPGEVLPWGEAHNSFGVTALGTNWGLAEGRVGTERGYTSYILLANPQTTAAEVLITYLRDNGLGPIVKSYVVPPTSRYNVDVNSVVPELQNEFFGALVQVTNGVNIAVERSMYWNALGIFWSGGTNATAVRVP